MSQKLSLNTLLSSEISVINTVAGQTVELEQKIGGLSVGCWRIDRDLQLVVSVRRGQIDEFVVRLATTDEYLPLLCAASQFRVDHTHVAATLARSVKHNIGGVWFRGFGAITWRTRERQPITGVWERSPQRGSRGRTLVGESRGKAH